MFVGSLIVMTGCFGGSDGIGAILGAAVFVLAITASGGSGAAAFAANQNPSLRPAISLTDAAAAPTFKVYPLDAAGNKVGNGTPIATDQISHDSGNFKAELQIQDNYTQYLVEVYAHGKLITQGIQSVPTTAKAGTNTKIPTTVNPTSTAKTMIFNNWKTAGRGSYSDFSYNLDKANAAAAGTVNVTAISNSIDGQLNTWAENDKSSAPDYSAAELTASTEANDVPTTYQVFNIGGTVYRKDGTVMDAAELKLYGMATNTAFVADYATGMTLTANSNGYFTNDANHPLPAGGYVLYPPSIPNHDFDPHYRAFEITNSDISGLNFKAKEPILDQHPGNSR